MMLLKLLAVAILSFAGGVGVLHASVRLESYALLAGGMTLVMVGLLSLLGLAERHRAQGQAVSD